MAGEGEGKGQRAEGHPQVELHRLHEQERAGNDSDDSNDDNDDDNDIRGSQT